MSDWIIHFVAGNIYGLALVIAPVCGLLYLLLHKVIKVPSTATGLILVIVGFLLFVVLISMPRYIFERSTLDTMASHKEYRLVYTAKYGEFYEPLTWFNTPVGFFQYVGPSDMPLVQYDQASSEHELKTIYFRYEEQQEVAYVDADCGDRKIIYSAFDDGGTLRYLSRSRKVMSEQEYEIYCGIDYTTEMEELRHLILELNSP